MDLTLAAKINHYIKKEEIRIWMTIIRPLLFTVSGLFFYVFLINIDGNTFKALVFCWLMTVLLVPLTFFFFIYKFDKEKKFINQWKKWNEEKDVFIEKINEWKNIKSLGDAELCSVLEKKMNQGEIAGPLLGISWVLPEDLPNKLLWIARALVDEKISNFQEKLKIHFTNEPKPSKKIYTIIDDPK